MKSMFYSWILLVLFSFNASALQVEIEGRKVECDINSLNPLRVFGFNRPTINDLRDLKVSDFDRFRIWRSSPKTLVELKESGELGDLLPTLFQQEKVPMDLIEKALADLKKGLDGSRGYNLSPSNSTYEVESLSKILNKNSVDIKNAFKFLKRANFRDLITYIQPERGLPHLLWSSERIESRIRPIMEALRSKGLTPQMDEAVQVGFARRASLLKRLVETLDRYDMDNAPLSEDRSFGALIKKMDRQRLLDIFLSEYSEPRHGPDWMFFENLMVEKFEKFLHEDLMKKGPGYWVALDGGKAVVHSSALNIRNQAPYHFDGSPVKLNAIRDQLNRYDLTSALLALPFILITTLHVWKIESLADVFVPVLMLQQYWSSFRASDKARGDELTEIFKLSHTKGQRAKALKAMVSGGVMGALCSKALGLLALGQGL